MIATKRSLLAAITLLFASCAPSTGRLDTAPEAEARAPAPAIDPAAGMPVATEPTPPGPARRVIVVTIDGLMPETYTNPAAHGLSVPVLRRLRTEGASSDGALSVYPSLTYPAHTSIASGVVPARHGVVSNSAFDPLGTNQDGWRWYSTDVKAPRVWDLARAAGYRTAIIDWPVTVGADATLHVPEFWRAHVDEDLKLISALSTPKDILQRVGAVFPNFREGFRPQDVSDEAGFDIAVYALREVDPHLLFLHVWQVDAAQHKFGLWSPEAVTAIEEADRQLGRLLAEVESAGQLAETAFVVASDHGFRNVERCFNPRALLEQAKLLTRNTDGKIESWQATVHPNHGSAFVYLNGADPALEARVQKLFDDRAKAEPNAIARVLSRAEVVAMGGDPDAFLGLEAAPGAYFGPAYDKWQTPPRYRANHGYDPNLPVMRASLLLFGAGVAPRNLADARIVDVAPTVASWLGLSMGDVDGRVLEVAAGLQ